METYTTEQQRDFDYLHETSMQWTQEIWAEQVKDGRFTSPVGTFDFDHKYIYWFENYVSFMAGRNILKKIGESYGELFDSATEQWCLTSSYQDVAWL